MSFRPALSNAITPAVFRPVVLPAAVATPLVLASPARISWVLLRNVSAVGMLAFSPLSDPTVGGLRIDGPGGFAMVSQDVWFSLTTWPWFAYSAMGETVFVAEMARNR